MNKEAWIRFYVPVDAKSSLQLLQVIDHIQKEGFSKINLLISSNGGDVMMGITTYLHIKSLGLNIDTYGMGNVDSIATLIYCLGKNRYASKYTTFIIHDVDWSFTGSFNINADKAIELALSVKERRNMINNILASELNKDAVIVLDDMRKGVVLNYESAKEYGLITKDKEININKDEPMFVIDQYVEDIPKVKVANYSKIIC